LCRGACLRLPAFVANQRFQRFTNRNIVVNEPPCRYTRIRP
jgi:hypothetical protein